MEAEAAEKVEHAHEFIGIDDVKHDFKSQDDDNDQND